MGPPPVEAMPARRPQLLLHSGRQPDFGMETPRSLISMLAVFGLHGALPVLVVLHDHPS